MGLGTPLLRSRIAVLIDARKRYAHAASTSTLLTCEFPVRVMCPRCLLSPLECSDGTRPRYAINCGAVSKREITQFSRDDHRRHELHAAQRLERLHQRRQLPGSRRVRGYRR